MQGTSGKRMEEIYTAAWKMGLKTTYYLRTMAISQIEKSTLDAVKYYFTQKRNYRDDPLAAKQSTLGKVSRRFSKGNPSPAGHVSNFKDLTDSECDACT